MTSQAPILISNSFPFALIRRKVTVEPMPIEVLQVLLRVRPVISAWGHANTLEQANRISGVDLKPRSERPAITLDEDGLPCLEAHSHRECWLLSPDYAPGFRPKPGEEVPPESIVGWQVLRLTWK